MRRRFDIGGILDCNWAQRGSVRIIPGARLRYTPTEAVMRCRRQADNRTCSTPEQAESSTIADRRMADWLQYGSKHSNECMQLPKGHRTRLQ
jgi:hypothetical protein